LKLFGEAPILFYVMPD